jgi:hypothetical protein
MNAAPMRIVVSPQDFNYVFYLFATQPVTWKLAMRVSQS